MMYQIITTYCIENLKHSYYSMIEEKYYGTWDWKVSLMFNSFVHSWICRSYFWRPCYHIYSSQTTIFYFSARSLTYEMLRWVVLMDHYFVSGLLYSPMSGLSLRTLRFEDWCSHSVICRAVSDAQIGSSVFSLDRWWFRWIICMVMTRRLLYCVMVIIALILIFVTYTSI